MTQKSKHEPTDGFTVVSLFSGAGGLDYGFEAAGFRTAVTIDFDPDCCRTLRANRKWTIVEKCIHETTSREILERADLRQGEADIIIGGPPCQPFSKAGYWASGDTRRLSDPRGRTLEEYMRCVNDLLPKAFLLENVHGINYSGKEEGFNLLKTLTDKINERHGTKYQLAWRVLNTADYGVPQVRQRFFLVAHREGKVFQFPDPTHNLGLWPCVTAWDAIGDLKPPPDEHLAMRGKWADLLPSIPEGENYLWHTNRKGGMRLFGWRTRYWSFLLKLAKDKPAWTIQAQPGPAIGPFHWTNRMLSSLELAALQTFPKGIKFCGGRVSVQRQLGNAVPSLMGEVLAREILLQFFGRRVGSTCKLSIELKRPIPPPEKVMRVPSQYLNLLGNHEDHPGDGLGPKGLSQEKLDAA